MPMYEYQCPECDSRFELLRPAREASLDQPCPTCDADSRRVMSKQWSAFVFRDGRPRQLPDDGGYWHLGQKVSQPITGAVRGVEHPEVNKQAPPKPLSVEELERYEYAKEQHVRRRSRQASSPSTLVPVMSSRKSTSASVCAAPSARRRSSAVSPRASAASSTRSGPRSNDGARIDGDGRPAAARFDQGRPIAR